MQPPESIDLSKYKIESHVREALTTALALAAGSPLNAATALNAAFLVSRRKKSAAFSKWASFFPKLEVKAPESQPISNVSLAAVPANSFLAESFRSGEPFFRDPKAFWGRDYITLALLAEGDPSLAEIASAADRSIDALRDEWFRFLNATPASSRHRNWTGWWRERGLNLATTAEEKPAEPKTSVVPPPNAPPVAQNVSAHAATPAPAKSSVPSSTPGPTPQSPPAPSAQARPPDVWMLADRPLESHFAAQDRFQFQDYANALAAVLDHEKTGTPFTMAINAPWGAGKTTLANMMAEQLRQRPRDRGHAPHIICWFNAWMHDDAPNLATAFIAEVGRTADRARSPFRRVLSPLPAALLEPRSRSWRRAFIALLILVPTLATSLWIGSHLERIERYKKYEASKSEEYQTTTTVVTDASGKDVSKSEARSQSKSSRITPAPLEPFALGLVDRGLESVQAKMVVLGAFFAAFAGVLGVLAKLLGSTPLGGFVQSPDKAAEIGAIDSAQKQLQKLIEEATWRGNRFIVFVDDIERCKPPRSVDVLDAVNQLTNQKGMVVVILGDMSAVAAAAQFKYKDIAEIFAPSSGIAPNGSDRSKEAFGRLYLQKIIQFQFDLPILPMHKIRQYMKELVAVPQSGGGADGRA